MKIKVLVELDVKRTCRRGRGQILMYYPIPRIKKDILEGIKYGLTQKVIGWEVPAIYLDRMEIIK